MTKPPRRDSSYRINDTAGRRRKKSCRLVLLSLFTYYKGFVYSVTPVYVLIIDYVLIERGILFLQLIGFVLIPRQLHWSQFYGIKIREISSSSNNVRACYLLQLFTMNCTGGRVSYILFMSIYLLLLQTCILFQFLRRVFSNEYRFKYNFF